MVNIAANWNLLCVCGCVINQTCNQSNDERIISIQYYGRETTLSTHYNTMRKAKQTRPHQKKEPKENCNRTLYHWAISAKVSTQRESNTWPFENCFATICILKGDFITYKVSYIKSIHFTKKQRTNSASALSLSQMKRQTQPTHSGACLRSQISGWSRYR